MLEVLAPLLFSMIIMYLRLNSVPRERPPMSYLALNVSLLPDFLRLAAQSTYQLVYVPSQSDTLKAVTEAVAKAFEVEFEGGARRREGGWHFQRVGAFVGGDGG